MSRDRQDFLYAEAHAKHSATMRRIVRAYETDFDKQRDLLQDIYLELWQSLGSFDGRCSLNTWVYRVAHNVAASHVGRNKRLYPRLVDVEELEADTSWASLHTQNQRRCSAESLLDLIYRLKPLDRQILLLHLEGETAESTAEVTGLSAGNVATKIHRIKKLLKEAYMEETLHAPKS
jgi:RNA polymerase sigma-70 factor (ECF subfamily)